MRLAVIWTGLPSKCLTKTQSCHGETFELAFSFLTLGFPFRNYLQQRHTVLDI